MPATGNFILDKGYDAESVLLVYRGVKLGTAAESVTAITAAGENGIGVAQFGVSTAQLANGKGGSIRHQGITEWEAGAAITKQAAVTVDNVGRCVPAVATNRVWGYALQAAAGSGVRISVELVSGAKPIMA